MLVQIWCFVATTLGLIIHSFQETVITPAMMWHGFPLPINKDMENILLHYNMGPTQLSPLVVLMSE